MRINSIPFANSDRIVGILQKIKEEDDQGKLVIYYAELTALLKKGDPHSTFRLIDREIAIQIIAHYRLMMEADNENELNHYYRGLICLIDELATRKKQSSID